MLHDLHEKRRAQKHLERLRRYLDGTAFDLARLGDPDLNILLNHGQLRGFEEAKVRTAKAIRRAYGADWKFNDTFKKAEAEFKQALEQALPLLTDEVLRELIHDPKMSEAFKYQADVEIKRRLKLAQMNAGQSPSPGGQEDWWRHKL
jgi:hypothetical protein